MKNPMAVSVAGLLPGWMHAPLLPAGIGKEARALAPAWLLIVLALGIGVLWPGETPAALWLLAGAYGPVVLGAIPAGHEFTNRTVAALLSQPVARSRLWRRKMGVLAAALVTTSVPALLGLLGCGGISGGEREAAVWVLIGAFMSGLLVTPWLTLACRGPLAGGVFTLALPALLFMLGQMLTGLVFGFGELDSPPSQRFLRAFLWLTLAAHWVAGGVLGWRAFARLENLESPQRALRVPVWRSRPLTAESALAARYSASPWLPLVIKELRLQEGSFFIAGMTVLGWALQLVVLWFRPETSLDYVPPLIIIYLMFQALLVGALSCAEERRLGVLPSQLMLPVSTRRQWLIKCGVTLALALGLALALPLALAWALPSESLRRDLPEAGACAGGAVMVLLCASLAIYFSSFSANGFRAKLGAFAGLVVGISLAVQILVWLERLARWVGWSVDAARWRPTVAWELTIAGTLLWVGLTLWFGYSNYRRLDFGVRRVCGHLACLALAVVVATGVYASVLYGCVLLATASPHVEAEVAPPPAPREQPARLDAERVR